MFREAPCVVKLRYATWVIVRVPAGKGRTPASVSSSLSVRPSAPGLLQATWRSSGDRREFFLLTQRLTPYKRERIWAIRIRLEIDEKHRHLELFNLAIDSKLRACDLLKLRVSDVSQGNRIASRAAVVQQKTVNLSNLRSPSKRVRQSRLDSTCEPQRIQLSVPASNTPPHSSTRQYARIVQSWVVSIGLDPAVYGTHSMRRTKASLVYRRTKNLWAVQTLLGHNKLESAVRYLGIEVDDALELAEQTEV